jgi:hypothetical protein
VKCVTQVVDGCVLASPFEEEAMRGIMSAALLMVACGSTGNQQMIEVSGTTPKGGDLEVHEVQSAGITVKLIEYGGGDLFKFDVKNLSTQPVLVDRDAVEMITATGERRQRLPGGTETSYALQPASAHHVNVRFDMSIAQQGDTVHFDFARALQLAGGGTVAFPQQIAVKFY